MTRFALTLFLVFGMLAGACAPTSQAPSAVGSSLSPLVSPTSIPSSTAASSPSGELERLMVAGSTLEFTAELPNDWESFGFGASSEKAGSSFFVTHVDNTFDDPCAHIQRSPKVGPSVESLVTALQEIPGVTASEPTETTIAGFDATYLELAIPAVLPCEPNEFWLWQDSPGAGWWVQDVNETTLVWIIEVDGQHITLAAHTYPDTTEVTKAELHEILESIDFEG